MQQVPNHTIFIKKKAAGISLKHKSIKSLHYCCRQPNQNSHRNNNPFPIPTNPEKRSAHTEHEKEKEK